MNMTSTIQLSGFLRREPYPLLLWSLVVVLAIRILLYLLMSSAGYFYGIPWDTFSRTSLAWQWAHEPYFLTDGYWLPLQFWIVGTVYKILRPFGDTSSILVPVTINNLFFAGSALITGLMAFRLGGRSAVWWAVILGAIFPADIFVSYSGLAEPIYIFFILLASYRIVSGFLDKRLERTDWAIGVGLATLLATATHYIGWFFALFAIALLGYCAFRSIQHRQSKQFTLYAISIILCTVFPILWLVNNFSVWGDPLHFMRIASQLQTEYAGNLSLRGKIGILFKVLLTTLPILCGLGGMAIAYFARKDIRKIIYLAPAFMIFAALWLTTFFAYTAPYQEPRYMVVFGWIVIPFIAGWLSFLWWQKEQWLRGLVLTITLAAIAVGLFETFHFTNSFGAEVRQVASRAGQWLESQPATARIVLHSPSFAETGVIPVVAGYPDRFIIVDDGRWREPTQATTIIANAVSQKHMVIVKDAVLVFAADRDKIELERLGPYFIIVPKAIP